MSAYVPGVTAVVPVHQPRLGDGMFDRMMHGIRWQQHPVDAISIAVDTTHAGAAATRNAALRGVRTEWTAFCDSDDQWRPGHIRSLLTAAEDSGADLVYPWFTIAPVGQDPWPEREGQPFDREVLRQYNYIPVTVLVRTQLIQFVGGFQPKGPSANPCDDWGTWDALLAEGAKFHHLNERTWYWWWHASNTNGRGDVW
jgi:glycosyltransferase involved in cell wall biosynthesis